MTSDPALAKEVGTPLRFPQRTQADLANASSFKSGNPPKGLAWERARMREYIDNGTFLGWLINRQNKQVEIYRPGKNVEILNAPQSLSGDNVLSKFILNLELIW